MDTIRRRGQSDEILSEMWVILPVLAVAAILVLGVALVFIVIASGTQIGFGALILAAIGVSLLSLVLFLVLNYKLLKRQHEHIAREAALRRALIDFFKAKGTESGYNVYQYVQAMEAIDRDAAFNEKQRDPLLWTLVPLIPLVGWILWYYALWFLTEFTPHHDRRWVAFAPVSYTHLTLPTTSRV